MPVLDQEIMIRLTLKSLVLSRDVVRSMQDETLAKLRYAFGGQPAWFRFECKDDHTIVSAIYSSVVDLPLEDRNDATHEVLVALEPLAHIVNSQKRVRLSPGVSSFAVSMQLGATHPTDIHTDPVIRKEPAEQQQDTYRVQRDKREAIVLASTKLTRRPDLRSVARNPRADWPRWMVWREYWRFSQTPMFVVCVGMVTIFLFSIPWQALSILLVTALVGGACVWWYRRNY